MMVRSVWSSSCARGFLFQKAASNGLELLLGPTRRNGSSLCHASRGPRSRDALKVGSAEEMISRPSLDLMGDAEAVASVLEQSAQGNATILEIFQIFKTFRGKGSFPMPSNNSRKAEDPFEHGAHLLGGGLHHLRGLKFCGQVESRLAERREFAMAWPHI